MPDRHRDSPVRGYHDWALISPRYAAGGIAARGENLEDPLRTTAGQRCGNTEFAAN